MHCRVQEDNMQSTVNNGLRQDQLWPDSRAVGVDSWWRTSGTNNKRSASRLQDHEAVLDLSQNLFMGYNIEY